jgi:chemotaxis protein histidine kinase CheA
MLNTAEAHLQQELRTLFDLDTQKYLQLYISTAQNLNEESWKHDIQQIYRCVHTIKGGAVTVGAQAILEVAAVLEDLLSDLRYLDTAPILSDRQLQDILVEAGELLVGSLESFNPVTSSVQRILAMRSLLQQIYLPNWSDQDQLYQEFAEQGFDLVVLELDMAIEQLMPHSSVPPETVVVAAETMMQLGQIGEDISLGKAWESLLAESQTLIQNPSSDVWLAEWSDYLRSLKECAKNGGKVTQAVVQKPESSPEKEEINPEIIDPIEEELRNLFNLDTQNSLQLYIGTVQQLQEANWKQDVQQMYRAIHTIKGGAVTVGAEAILQVSTVFEDLLSDLRNVDSAPSLSASLKDNSLQQILTECGELLVASLNSLQIPTASISRILDLQAQIKSTYLEEWNEQKQLAREFAEQGFDLVILDLEIAIEQLPETGSVPADSLDIATMTLAQLQEIGIEIGLAPDWQDLLAQTQTLLSTPDCELWQSQFMDKMGLLKAYARNGGKIPLLKSVKLVEPELPLAVGSQVIESEDIPDIAALLKAIPQSSNQYIQPKRKTKPKELAVSASDVQIPVPLERLDRSSQHLIETLMATRATQGFYQSVYANLLPIVSLAQDSIQYIGQLRAVQDDYALLDSAKDSAKNQTSPEVESYRQGYTAINRLLEISLRLSELGAETGESARKTAESLQRLERSLRGLQQTLEESRLVSFESLSFRVRGILRDLTTRNLDKRAQMSVVGEKLELDAGTLRNLEPVLLHLIRNSFDHGLESVGERAVIGKPQKGTITMSLVRRGSVFILKVSDDGRGIDPEWIRNVAIAKNLPLSNTNTSVALLDVICQPGFTSAETVSDISGRGVGMDVVANQIESIGGHLSLETKLGIGTTFTIQIPVPNLFVRCMLLQAGDRTFAIPTSDIFTTMLLGDLLWQKQESALYSMSIEEDTGLVPALDLYQYWQGEITARSYLPTSIAVRTKRTQDTLGVWLIADTLVGQSDLLVNSIPSPLTTPVGVMGVSLQSNGKLIPVIDPISLIDRLLDPHQSAIAVPPQKLATEDTAQILVVDDAALMRRRIESSLSNQGYNIHTCSDGLEAWDWMQNHAQPTMLITDIEMPGMDGFTLIDRCRQAGMNMPIMVISSRLAEEWSKETKRLGADDYLTKGFTTPELLEKVATLLANQN